MIDMRLLPGRLVAHAQQQGHNVAQDEDFGYAVHAWLRAALGDLSPRVFRILEQRHGDLRLLGYGPADAASIREHVQQFASPLAAEVCRWPDVASKPLDGAVWRAKQQLRFEVRVCPVVRGKDGERDAFLAQLPAEGEPAPAGRVDVYRKWLAARVSGGARVEDESVRLKAFRLVNIWRQGFSPSAAERKGRRLVRPDALLTGRLTVEAPAAFAALLETGIGRHRAFGFGMLLLSPP